VEAGVGLITVPWMLKQSEENFDTHNKNFPKMKDKLLPPVDCAVSALIEDLEQRGLLGETLVVWTGEFGRTPKINNNGGRDHWGRVYSTMLAGGGVRGGRVYGKSDKVGGSPVDNPVHVSDFVATIYHALGYGPGASVTDPAGRPFFFVQGKPVAELF
jgi:arylsulfatase A-like enzyme